ncbi:DUF429 domain-containing protein [candidate division KSB1 bacterium]|nr:DUF429 domain-containing protein [candidate division KSB1 bacterium]
MPAHILGIDAAWTAHQPSGVALLRARRNAKPKLIALGRSYDEFLTSGPHAKVDWRTRVRGCLPPIDALLSHCKKLTGELPQIVALDIPLAAKPLNGRRPCDNAVTAAYVSRGAGTHTPNAQRPGPISASLFHQLCAAGYHWHTHGAAPRAKRVFLETYPHPAIIELMRLPMRLAYKTARSFACGTGRRDCGRNQPGAGRARGAPSWHRRATERPGRLPGCAGLRLDWVSMLDRPRPGLRQQGGRYLDSLA